MKTTSDSEGRRPQETAKINASSLPEIRNAINRERDRLRGLIDNVVDGRPLERAHLINAWSLWMLRQPEAFRDQVSIEGCAIYQDHLASVKPVVVAGEESAAVPLKSLQAKGALGPGSDKIDRDRNNNSVANLGLPRSKK